MAQDVTPGVIKNPSFKPCLAKRALGPVRVLTFYLPCLGCDYMKVRKKRPLAFRVTGADPEPFIETGRVIPLISRRLWATNRGERHNEQP